MMYRILRNIQKMGTKSCSRLGQGPKASITTLNLNSKPLPKQPVPDLNKTAEKFLRSLRPLLTEQEFNNSEKVVMNFIGSGGEGPSLHKKLIERFNETENWMSDWWLSAAYLGYRAPVIFNSSPGTIGPPVVFKSPTDMHLYAARLIRAICNYDKMVKSGKMKQEMARDAPLDMQPYGMILGTHRRPNSKCDVLLHTDDSNHIVVMCNNHFYKLCLIDESGVLSEEKLTATIADIYERSRQPGTPVGVLTGQDRDTWADVYCTLIGLGKNKQIIADIETALFVLCLDKDLPKDEFRLKNNASVRSIQGMTGYSSSTNTGNRWHDKTVQYIISTDGFVGMEYEHSPCEGVPVAVLHDYVLNTISSQDGSCESTTNNFPKAELLCFETNNTIDCAIKKATRAVDTLSQNIDMECFNFSEFGANKIKEMKLSPDSFIQIAMQITYYKIHGKPPAHYESAALRRFKNARTECIRSTSCESVAFAEAMTKEDSNAKKRELMVKAINAHKNLAGEAAMGQGVDRHLFGLKSIALEEGQNLPAIFKDIGYTKSTYFNLTSSQVPYKTASFMCYGPVVPDGYGCCYNPRPNDIFFACSSFYDCKITDTKCFAETLQQALRDMRTLACTTC